MADEARAEGVMQDYRDVFDRLLRHFGPQHWWPGESPLEVMVGAVLTQNTNWQNVERALACMRAADALRFDRLLQMPEADLANLIRPAGYFRVKARRLKNLLEYVASRHAGSIETMFQLELAVLRAQLLEIHGIGPETADSILLYAGQMPVFVVDAYTVRCLVRHGWWDPPADYHGIQSELEHALPRDVELFNEFHALIVRLGKTYCRKQPICVGCPLESLLPVGGPIDLVHR